MNRFSGPAEAGPEKCSWRFRPDLPSEDYSMRAMINAFAVTLLSFVVVIGTVCFSGYDAFGQMMEGGWHGGTSTTLSTFETDDFSGSGVCAFCHSGLKDSAGSDVSIDAQWRSTMMANSAKDPLWQAKMESEVTRNPAIQAVIEEKCSRCHMGMARYQAITDGTTVNILGEGFLDPGNLLHEAAMDGVSCSLCHQIQNIGLGTPGSYTGLYFIDTYTSPPARLAFSRYGQPFKNPMEMHSGFSPEAGYHISDAALCGTCHTVYTPALDAAGKVIGEFPEQTTYLEWRHSETLRTCQECHLPDASGGVVISSRPRMLSPREPFGEHHFVGGNSFMLTLLKNNAAELGITAEAALIDATVSRTNSMLNSAARVSIASASLQQGVLNVVLEVQNLTGHKLPSGIPLRRAWLHMTVRDKAGRIIFESGKPQADGSIVGNDADLQPGACEPHYDSISAPDQVQIYESVMADTRNLVTYTLLRAYTYAKDNRLLPQGFDKKTAPQDIAVRGPALDDENFSGGLDKITYRVAVKESRKPLTVSAELLYQAVGYPFLLDFKQDKIPSVQRFLKFVEVENMAPAVVSNAAFALP
jgi:hypothetical protein